MKTEAIPDLKPCPFCGGKNVSLDNLGDDNSWNIECEDGCGGLHSNFTRAQAIALWNRKRAE